MLNGESRGSPQADNASEGNIDVMLRGIDSGIDHLIYNNKTDRAYGHIYQCKKLAEHTVMHPRSSLCQVTMTVVMHAVGTLG